MYDFNFFSNFFVSILYDFLHISINTGVAPEYEIQFEVATKLFGVVKIISPCPIFAIVAALLQSQVTPVTRVSQGYAFKAVHSRLMSGGAALDMHMKLSAGHSALLLLSGVSQSIQAANHTALQPEQPETWLP